MKLHRVPEDPPLERIVELENQLDREFRKHVPPQPLPSALLSAAQLWSQAVWNAAGQRGAQSLTGESLTRELAFAQRPVFICGVQRSGTTLLRDLLDGHPQLVVIPTESALYASLERATFGSRLDRVPEYLARQWLERLVLPPPRWLLGRSSAVASPYVTFASDFAAWMMLSTHRREAKTPSWPLCAFALAYARRLGSGRVSAETRWVEKSPASERFLSRIWHDFPAAKVIHIVREPGAVLRSYAALNSHHWGARRAATHCLLNMAPSYKIARRGPLQFQPDRYLLVRYEDLVADRESAMMRVAEFLGIVPLATLREPTVAGRPALNNTSFAEGTPRPITRLERTLLTLAVARNARGIGYR